MNPTYDVVVLGAGLAGLTAARALAEAKKRVLVLEAGKRIGGRVWTVPGTAGSLPSELGAEFVHGKPEPTLRLAREAGIELVPLADRHFSKEGTAFRELPNPWRTLAEMLGRVQAEDADTNMLAFLEQHAIDPRLRERVRQLVEGFEAAPLSQISIRSLATDAQSLVTDTRQYRVQGGYGTLLDFYLKKLVEGDVELRLQSRVTRVKWQIHGPVALGVAGAPSEVCARSCVITVPLPVLQDPESLRFEPEVRTWSAPLAQLGMGQAARVTLQFRRDFAEGLAPRNAFIHRAESLFEVFWSHENRDFVQWTAWAGGPKAEELACESSEQRQRLALAALGSLLGLPAATLEAASTCPLQHHDFTNDPLVRGGYSFCRPGGSRAAQALSAPIGGALFLAGEATDHEYPGTVAGAIESGARAAKQALAVLDD